MGCLNKLTASFAENCQNISPGIGDLIYFLNYDEVDKASCTFNSSNSMILENISLSGTATAYTLKGQKMSNTKEHVYAPGKFVPGYTHTHTFIIFDNEPVTKARIKELESGKFMVIYKNIYDNRNKVGTPSDSVYELSGYDSGLILTELTNANADASGGFYVKLSTPTDAKESSLPLTVFAGSYSATTTMITGLLT